MEFSRLEVWKLRPPVTWSPAQTQNLLWFTGWGLSKRSENIPTHRQKLPSAPPCAPRSWSRPFPRRRPASSRWCRSSLRTQSSRSCQTLGVKAEARRYFRPWTDLTGRRTSAPCSRARAGCSWRRRRAAAAACTCPLCLCTRRAWGGSCRTVEERTAQQEVIFTVTEF